MCATNKGSFIYSTTLSPIVLKFLSRGLEKKTDNYAFN